MSFTKAERKKSKLRMALIGASGSGKTYTALQIAQGLVGETGKVALIDTERGSASLYADMCSFDVCELETFEVKSYVRAIREAESASYDCIIIDSLSHAWNGVGGVLDVVNAASERYKGNTYSGWKEGTPLQNELIDTLLSCKMHVIVTMRSKTEYALEMVNGKNVPRKIGLAPIQRDGVEYEFTIMGYMDDSNTLRIEKTRLAELSQSIIHKPDIQFGKKLRTWLEQGVEVPIQTSRNADIIEKAQVAIVESTNAPIQTSMSNVDTRMQEIKEGVDKAKQEAMRALATVYAKVDPERKQDYEQWKEQCIGEALGEIPVAWNGKNVHDLKKYLEGLA